MKPGSAQFLELLFSLSQMRGRSLHAIAQFVLDHGTEITQSTMGFLGFMSENEQTFLVQAYTDTVMTECQVAAKTLSFDVAKSGWWGDALRQRTPLIVNDFATDSPSKTGTPAGHVPIQRFICVPLVHDGRVVSAMAVSNKPEPYTDVDVAMLEMALGAQWAILSQHQELDSTYSRLKSSDGLVRDIAASLPGAVFQFHSNHDGSWNAPFVSDHFLEVFGLDPADIRGNPMLILDSILPADRDELMAEAQLCATEGRPQHRRFRIRVGGEVRTLETHSRPRTDSDGSVVWNGVFHDVTNLVSLESQLQGAQKLEAVGRLAAGVAHEINTPMQYIGDNTNFVKQSVEDLMSLQQAYRAVLAAVADDQDTSQAIADARVLEQTLDTDYLIESVPAALNDCLEGIRRVSEIVAAMKQFAHPGQGTFEPTDINSALRTTLIVSRNEWKYVAKVQEELDPALSHISALSSELNQVWLNLVINAAHAIADKVRGTGGLGQLTVASKQNASSVTVSIRDSGRGIPESARPRLFEPFFTTKPEGKGTGQGLAIAWDVIVNKHRGKIWFETETDVGTAFHVELPLARREEEPE